MIESESILGTWHLVSATELADGSPVDSMPLGPKPSGIIHYLPDRRVAVIIAHDGRQPISTGDRRKGPVDEMAAAAASFDAYAGTWDVTGEDEITHWLDLCSFENDRNAAYVRQVSWNGVNIVLTTPQTATAQGSRCMALEWERRPS